MKYLDYKLNFIIKYYSKILQIEESFQEDLGARDWDHEKFEKISKHYKNVAVDMFVKDDINSDKIVDRSEFKSWHNEL